MQTPLLGKAVTTVAVLVAASLPLLAGAPASPEAAAFASLASRDLPRGTVMTARKVIDVGADHSATKTMPSRPGAPTRLYLRSTLTKEMKMTASGMVGASVRASIKKCYNTTQNVWLTFDDGYTSQANLSSILDTLSAYNVRGRFFLVGTWARSHASMVNQIVAAGHFVENHTNTHTHTHLNQISDAAVQTEIALGQPSNTSPKLLRPPYGDGAFTVRLYNIALEHGYQLCDWSTDTRDWTGASASIIVKRVVHGDRATPRAQAGDTILMHLKNTQTRNALSRLIKGLRARGLTFDQLR